MKNYIIIILTLQALCLNVGAQEKLKGRVVDAQTQEPMAGALLKIKEQKQTIITDNNGFFELSLPNGNYILQVQYLSYAAKEIPISLPLTEPLLIKLTASTNDLQEVQVVSTGYQTLPKERATGSFTVIDQKTLNRIVSPDILSRLKGVTNGLLFDGSVGNATGISVRGRSTIFSNTSPLIVVDNFPFEGDLNTINPDIVETVTLLKDAAAASIWGVRAGNGVIVITTKKGKFEQKPVITLKTDLTIGQKPDLYYQPQLSSSEFIALEQFLFEKGKYTATINNGFATISPVVALLQKMKLDPNYVEQGRAEIDRLKNIDARDQRLAYFYRSSLRQHYHLDAAGGSKNQTYYFSAGYDNNLPSLVALSDSRVTLKGSNTYSFFAGKLKLANDISFSQSTNKNDFTQNLPIYVPYEEIADSKGSPLATLIKGGLRASYTDTAGNGKLLDWKYYPLEELKEKYANNITSLTDYRVNLSLNYQIIDGLAASVNYQYYNANSKIDGMNTNQSFYTRNRINSYSQINSATDDVLRAIPLGAIYTPTFVVKKANYGRAQLSYTRLLNQLHGLNIIAGYEVRDDGYRNNSYTLFGYVPETATNIIVDQISPVQQYYGSGAAAIGEGPRQFITTNRYISYYANASYAFSDRYILSGSYRKDESNIFGVKANQKGVPLWSAGLAWNIHKEHFFKDRLALLQLKFTYGYNGNVNNSVTAYLTASPGAYNQFNRRQFYDIVNPPNDGLRWEKVRNINFGLNFELKNHRLSGSLEFYTKQGFDLIATSPIAPQTGISTFIGNAADTYAKGVDMQINATLLRGGFKWTTTAIFNYVRDEIKNYKVAVGNNSSIVTSSTFNLTPLKGYPINAIFAYPWAGLDKAGNPQGIINATASLDYNMIRNAVDVGRLKFFGSATPIFFGSFRNTFAYKQLELSVNLSYKLGYYFKKPALNYAALFDGSFNQPDYASRWQQPGDEQFTDVPSLIYPTNANRNDFYNNAEVHVQKGDHLRLQDIQLNYSLSKKEGSQLPFKDINIYAFANNLGLLWKANRKGLDPEQLYTFPNPKTISLGFKAHF